MPFVPAETNERQIKYIPVEYTLGCSWRWWPEHAENDKDKIIDFINNLEQAQSTSYTFISNLGIVLASEGKIELIFVDIMVFQKYRVMWMRLNTRKQKG